MSQLQQLSNHIAMPLLRHRWPGRRIDKEAYANVSRVHCGKLLLHAGNAPAARLSAQMQKIQKQLPRTFSCVRRQAAHRSSSSCCLLFLLSGPAADHLPARAEASRVAAIRVGEPTVALPVEHSLRASRCRNRCLQRSIELRSVELLRSLRLWCFG